MLLVGVAIASAIGAPARYLLDGLVAQRSGTAFPLGTLVINVSGSFLLGLLGGTALHQGLTSSTKTILGTGFCGAYTTFSTFTYETLRLIEEGSIREAAINIVASLVLGLGFAAFGLWITTIG